MSKDVEKVQSRLAPSFLPATAVLEMTYRCNHQCIFCSCPWENPAGGFPKYEELSIDAWKDVLRTLAGMGVCHFAFTGGEPLLKDGLLELIEYAATLTAEHIESGDNGLESRLAPPKLYLLSNGSAVDWAVLDFCKRIGVQLSMSLPGLSTYREHTGAGDPNTFSTCSARPRNGHPNGGRRHRHAQEPRRVARNARGGVSGRRRQLLLNRFLPGGRGLEHADELSLDRDEVRQMLDTAEEVLGDANRFGSVGTELPSAFWKAGDTNGCKWARAVRPRSISSSSIRRATSGPATIRPNG